MTQPNDGGPAFPTPYSMQPGFSRGLTLRDWFAGKALEGLLANPNRVESMKMNVAEAFVYARLALEEREKVPHD